MTSTTARTSTPTAALDAGSLTWELFADHRMAFLGPRAAVLQNMLPALGQGVEDHSVWFADTLARLQRSIPPIFSTVYAQDDASGRVEGHRVRDFHRSIKGTLPAGERYSALNPETFYWAHACFVEHLVTATDLFIRRLSEDEKDQLARESVTWFDRYGVSAPHRPRSWAEFDGYFQRMLDERIVGHRTARYGVGYATKGWPRASRIPKPVWAVIRRPVNALSAFVTVGGLPPQARVLLGMPWTERQQRRYDRYAATARALAPAYDRLPGTWRLHPIALRAFAQKGVPA